MHLKRLAAPKTWKIPRKVVTWIARPMPGPHSISSSLPLKIILRDVLNYADNTREAKIILNNGQVKVDGRIRKDPNFGVGFMDVIELKATKEAFRLLPDCKGRLALNKIKADESKFKLVRIENKRIIKGDRLQLGFHDGRTCLVSKGKYSVGDVLKIEIPKQKIIERYSLTKNAPVLLIGGKHAGTVAKVKDIRDKSVVLSNDEEFETIKKHIFLLGKKKSVITVGESK